MRWNFSLVLCATLAGLPATAQTLEDVLAKNLKAHGGAKLAAATTMRLSGRMTFGPGMDAPFTLERKRPNLLRIEFSIQGVAAYQAFDGKEAWMVNPLMGVTRPEPLPRAEAQAFEEQADFDGPLVGWKAKGHSLELAGQVERDGKSLIRVKTTLRGGTVLDILLDPATYLEARIESARSFQGNKATFETVLSDYRDVDGVVLPFSIEQGIRGAEQRQRIRFEKAETNVPLDDARFSSAAARKSASASN